MIFASDLFPSLTSFWWTAPTASNAFIGNLSFSGKSSIKWIIDDPELTISTTLFWRLIMAFFKDNFLSKDRLISSDLK